MTTEVEICNLALDHIASGGINSLDDQTPQARKCKLKYSILRDMVSRDVDWNFCRSIKPLALRADLDVFNWSYVYNYPTDCLKIQRLVLNNELNQSQVDSYHGCDVYTPDMGRHVPYEVMNINGEKVVVANHSDLRIEYTRRETNTLLFDSDFTMALSYLLAAELAIPIAGKDAGRALRADSLQMYGEYINSAAVNSLNESYQHPVESEFVTVRR